MQQTKKTEKFVSETKKSRAAVYISVHGTQGSGFQSCN